MRRPAIAVVLIAVTTCFAGGAHGALAWAQDVGSHPSLRARLTECSTGQSPAVRYAVFGASMPTVPGSVRMGIRFDLLQRTPGGAFAPVVVPRWGVWERSRPGVPGFLYSKRID